MTDERLRRLDRLRRAAGDAEDAAAWVRARVRAGLVAQWRLDLARALGHPVAALPGDPAPAPLADEGVPAAWAAALAAAGGEAPLRAALAAGWSVATRGRFGADDDLRAAWRALEAVDEALRAEAPRGDALRGEALRAPGPATRARLLDARREAEARGGWAGPLEAVGCALHLATPLAPDSGEPGALLDAAHWVERALLAAAWLEPGEAERAVRAEVGGWALELDDAPAGRPARLGLLVGDEPDIVRAAAWSPDGARALTSSRAGTVTLWDPARPGHAALALPRQGTEVFCAVFSPDGRRLYTGDGHGWLRAWDAATGAPRGAWRLGETLVYGLAALPGGTDLVAGGYDGRLVRVTVAGPPDGPGEEPGAGPPDGAPRELGVLPRAVSAFALAPPSPGPQVPGPANPGPAGRLLVASTGDDLWALDLARDEVVWRRATGASTANGLAFAPAPGLLVGACMHHALVLWDPASGDEVGRVSDVGAALYACAAARGRPLVATSSTDGALRLWDVARRACVHAWRDLPSLPLALAFSPDDRWLLVGGRGGDVRRFEVPA